MKYLLILLCLSGCSSIPKEEIITINTDTPYVWLDSEHPLLELETIDLPTYFNIDMPIHQYGNERILLTKEEYKDIKQSIILLGIYVFVLGGIQLIKVLMWDIKRNEKRNSC